MRTHRQARVSDMLCCFLAEEVRKLSDPRLAFVTITSVEVSKDLRSAKVYWTIPADTIGAAVGKVDVSSLEPERSEPREMTTEDPLKDLFPSAKRKKEADDALSGCESLLKRRIAEELDFRYVPQLCFCFDDAGEKGFRIEYLLSKAGY